MKIERTNGKKRYSLKCFIVICFHKYKGFPRMKKIKTDSVQISCISADWNVVNGSAMWPIRRFPQEFLKNSRWIKKWANCGTVDNELAWWSDLSYLLKSGRNQKMSKLRNRWQRDLNPNTKKFWANTKNPLEVPNGIKKLKECYLPFPIRIAAKVTAPTKTPAAKLAVLDQPLTDCLGASGVSLWGLRRMKSLFPGTG